MSSPLVNVVSGFYNAYYNGMYLGATEDGWEIDIIHKGMMVTAEEFGDTELDMISRGAQVRVRGIVKEWDAPGLMSALWGSPAFSSATGGANVDSFGEFFCAGTSAVRGIDAQGNIRSKPLVLTVGPCHLGSSPATYGSVQGEGFRHGVSWASFSGTPSWATTGPADVAMSSITFHRTIITPDSVSKINLNNKPRVVPIEFMAFLTDISGSYRFFSVGLTGL